MRSSTPSAENVPRRTAKAPKPTPTTAGTKGKPTKKPTTAGTKGKPTKKPTTAGSKGKPTAGRPAQSHRRASHIDKLKRAAASEKRKPNPDALKLAADVGSRRDAACNFRKSFARRPTAADEKPLLAQLVGGAAGRAAEPRVKLVLTLLYLAREGDAWTVEGVPAATWALLFGLREPEKLGAARVTAAIRALAKAEIIVADQRRGREPRLLVRHETGNDRVWTSPVGHTDRPHAPEDFYVQLDSNFWANGWITVLSARAIAALVILLDATWDRRGTDKVKEQVKDDLIVDRAKALVWWHLTEEQLTEQYAVSRDLFDRGVKELIDWHLVESRKRGIVERTTWGDRRWYRELRVRLEVLATPVADVAAGMHVPRIAHSSEDPLAQIARVFEVPKKATPAKKTRSKKSSRSGKRW